jgi:xanthine dehydrogenase accessory factor
VPKILATRIADLQRSRTPYVHARVVLAEKPTSAKPGDEAIIFSDGSMEGFVGGSCADSTVRSQSVSVLNNGNALLLRIAPMPEIDNQVGKLTVHNPCLSGGTLEIFLEPIMPAPLVAIYGDSPISGALLKQGPTAGYELVEWSAEVDLTKTFAVIVAAHGREDETMLLEAAVLAGVPYVGLVASRKRGASVVDMLNLTPDQKSSIYYPAGLDIGARTPDHIAISIMAEMVQAAANQSVDPAPKPTFETAIDPVCNMTVAMLPESIHAEIEGETIWFCAPGCLKAYSSNPAAYKS